MDISTKKPGDLTMAELMALVRETVRQVLEEEHMSDRQSQRGILAIEPLSMGEWTGDVSFIKREDFYDDTGR
jgi:hypothetical protein